MAVGGGIWQDVGMAKKTPKSKKQAKKRAVREDFSQAAARIVKGSY